TREARGPLVVRPLPHTRGTERSRTRRESHRICDHPTTWLRGDTQPSATSASRNRAACAAPTAFRLLDRRPRQTWRRSCLERTTAGRMATIGGACGFVA